jgi:hypothetical protein
MKINVLLVAAALAYGSSVVLAVPYQPNLVVREVATVEPINARELSDALVEARENLVSDLAAREVETEDIFEREPKGRGGRKRGKRGKRGKKGKGRRGKHSRMHGGDGEMRRRELDEDDLEGRELDEEEIFEREPKRRGRGRKRGRRGRSHSRGHSHKHAAATPPVQASEGSGEVEGREYDEDVELDAREYVDDDLDARELGEEEEMVSEGA